jgi:hypothetical protein
MVWLVSPLFCELLGFVIVCVRPRAILAWAFLALMLSLAQLQLWPDQYVNFQLTATPMAWTDWFRVPALGYRVFVQHIWPAAFLLGASHFYRANRRIFAALVSLATVFVLYAVLQAGLEIAWSEDFRTAAPLFRLQQQHRTELTIAAMAGIAGIGFLLDRKVGLAIAGCMLMATFYFYKAPGPLDRNWAQGSFLSPFPASHNTPSLIAMLFGAGCLLAVLVYSHKKITPSEVAGLALCLPFAVEAAGCFGEYWYMLGGGGPFNSWLVLMPTGLGMLGIARSVLRRTQNHVALS